MGAVTPDIAKPMMGERRVGQYLLEEKIGEGGMAEVWRARHQVLGTCVAIKFLAPGLAGLPDVEQRFLGEGKRQAQLSHPNIVSTFDFLYENERSYLIMKLVEGENLDDRIYRLPAPMPLSQTLSISTDVLRALDYAHSRNVIHRDIKPSNILIENDGRAYVMDFGIALVMGEQRATRVGVAIGTPHYMSPEQITGSRDIDCRADIYSFGCVLYLMLTQQLPFNAEPGEGTTDYAIKSKHLRETAKPVRQLNPNIPEHMERAVMRCLEKKPDDRFRSCQELLTALTTGGLSRGPAETIFEGPPIKIPLMREVAGSKPDAQPLPASPPQYAEVVIPHFETPHPEAPEPQFQALPSEITTQPPPKSAGLVLLVCALIVTIALTGYGVLLYARHMHDQQSGNILDSSPTQPEQTHSEPVNPQPQQINPPIQERQKAPVIEKPSPGKQTQPVIPPVQKPQVNPAETNTPVLSGDWHGQYTNHDTNQSEPVNLEISEDRDDVLSGTMAFDPGGHFSASCSLSGVYNPQNKFMLLTIGSCHGRPPSYLQGKVGFSAVNPDDRRLMGMDSRHNSWLEITR